MKQLKNYLFLKKRRRIVSWDKTDYPYSKESYRTETRAASNILTQLFFVQMEK